MKTKREIKMPLDTLDWLLISLSTILIAGGLFLRHKARGRKNEEWEYRPGILGRIKKPLRKLWELLRGLWKSLSRVPGKMAVKLASLNPLKRFGRQ